MSRTLLGLAASIAILALGPASAGNLTVEITDGGGALLADAVVTIRPQSNPAPAPPAADLTAPRIIDQRNEHFVPLVTILPAGGAIAFKNSERTRHHVYSFSPIKPFEFVLTYGQQSPPVMMAKTGIAAIGCNIHDRMVAYVFVTEAPFSALTGADGRAVFRDLREGTYRLQLWHPRVKSRQIEETTVEVPVAANNVGSMQKYTLSLSAERPHSGRHQREY